MTTAKSFFDKKFASLYKDTLNRTKALGFFYGLCMLATVPLMYLIQMMSIDNNMDVYREYFIGYGSSYTVLSAIALVILVSVVPIIIGTNIFSFMHNRAATDVYHAMPMSRGKMFTSTYLAGATIVNLPIVISFVLVAAIGAFNSGAYNVGYDPAGMLIEMLCWVVIATAIFTITSFVCTICGTGFDSSILSLGLCGFAPVVVFTARMTTESLLLGASNIPFGGIFNFENMVHLSPFSTMTMHFMDQFRGMDNTIDPLYAQEIMRQMINNFTAIGIWAVVTLVLFFAAKEIYKHRKSEIAGRTTTSSPLNRLMQYVVVYVSGILFGFIMFAMFDYSKWMFLLGLLIGGVLSFATFEAITSRGFKTYPKAFIHMAGSVGITMVFALALMTGLFGYQNRVPAVESIQSVTINYGGRHGIPRLLDYERMQRENTYDKDLDYNEYGYRFYDDAPLTLTTPETVTIVTEFHKAVIEEQKGLTSKEVTWDQSARFYPTISYTLKNGKTVNRAYKQPSAQVGEILYQIEATDEFNRQTNPAYLLNGEDLEKIIVYDKLGVVEKTIELSTSDYKKVLSAMRKDVDAETMSDLKDNEVVQDVGYVKLEFDPAKPTLNKTVPGTNTMVIPASYTNTLRALAEVDPETEALFNMEYNLTGVALNKSQYVYQNGSSPILWQYPNNKGLNEEILNSMKENNYNPWYMVTSQEDVQKLYDAAKLQVYSLYVDDVTAVYFTVDGADSATVMYLPKDVLPEIVDKYMIKEDGSYLVSHDKPFATTEDKTVTVVTTFGNETETTNEVEAIPKEATGDDAQTPTEPTAESGEAIPEPQEAKPAA